MIFNYFKIAFRSLRKNKGYSFLNIFGLAIGITCASFIFLWVEDELSFNTSFVNQDQIYYVPTNQNYEGGWSTFYSTPGPLAQVMKDEIPGISKASRSSRIECTFTIGDNAINRNGRYVDYDFLEIFNLQFLEGSITNAFTNPKAIVVTKSTAEALFGKGEKGLGKVIKMNNRDTYVVSGIIKDIPKNVTFPFDWIAPFERYRDGAKWMTEYGNNFSDTFVELSPEATFREVDQKVREILPIKNPDSDTYAFLHPIKDWHLRSKFKDGKVVGGQITYVRLFLIIAFIILLIACINFMNLSTARSEKRANEVGVRKAIGSSRSRLMLQFVIEALMMSFLATVISVLLLFLLLPQFNLLIEKDLIIGLTQPLHIFTLSSIAIICGVFAGFYPAFYLSSFKPVEVLKGIKVTSNSASFIRKGLVVGQFVISIVFIIGTIIVYQQIQHVKNRDLGYNKNHLIRMRANDNAIEKFSVIEYDLKNTGLIKGVALSNSQILSAGDNGSGLAWKGGTNTEDVLISYRHITSDFFTTTGIEILEGTGFKKNEKLDSTNILITQSLAKLMGAGSAIGKTITGGDDTFTVIGVTKNYQYGDMYAASDPVIFFNNSNNARYLYIKTASDITLEEILSSIEGVMKKNNPAFPFEYAFVDEAFDAKFKSEQLVGTLSQLFAFLAIFISCLGLFGLAAYMAEQRTKEIGIRKVLGASVTGIIQLLSKDFLKLVGISILIATPLAWLLMYNWLQDYAYRIEINWWVFIAAGVIAIIIALITVGFQAIKAAIANPINSLKTE